MSKLVYVDTNVWLDYVKNRKSKYLDFSEIALNIFQRAVSCEFKILISKALMFELEKHLNKSDLKELISWIKPKIQTISESKKDVELAKNINIHFPDNLHYFLSKKHNALLVSNDKEMQELGAISSQTL